MSRGWEMPFNLPVFYRGPNNLGGGIILSAHAEAEGIGEKPFIVNLAQNLATAINSTNSFPECLAEINQEQLSQFAEEQISLHAHRFPLNCGDIFLF